MLEFKEKQLLKLVEISKHFMDSTASKLSCQQIADYMLELSKGQYVAFNVYKSDGNEFKTVALSGDKTNIKKIEAILEFKVVNKVWNIISNDFIKTRTNNVNIIKNHQQLPKVLRESSKLQTIQATFKIGDIVIVNILKEKQIIGDFTIIMEKGIPFISTEIAKLYASQVALLMEKIKASTKHQQSRKRLQSIIEATNIGTWEWNIQTEEIILNELWAEMVGYTLEELSPLTTEKWLEFLGPLAVQKVRAELNKVLSNSEPQYSMKYRIKHKDGHWVTALDKGKIVSWTKDGRPLMMIGTHLDITENEQLKSEYERFFSVNLDLFCIADMDGNLINVNDSWKRLLGYDTRFLQTQNFLDFVHPDDIKKTKEAMARLYNKEEVLNFVNRYRYCDGSYGYIEWLSQPYDNLIYASGRDITEKYEKQQEVEFLSFRDYLTGLYNRRYIEDAIRRLNTPRNLPLTIMMLDINGLKLTNDAFGHQIGDALLKTVANIISKACRSDDIIGRMGGDEFLVILPNTDYKQAKKIKQRMIRYAKDTPVDPFVVSFAIGYAVKTMDSQDLGQIEKIADKNMYRHKSKYGKIMRRETIEAALSNVFRNGSSEQVHAERVSLFCEQIALAMGLCPSDVEDAQLGGVLHDIGKITVPPEIINKEGKLTKAEFEEVKRHSVTSYNILKGVDQYASLAEGVLYHHERPDGKGYPEGLKGNRIPLLSKIIAVADAYESMTSSRSYKETKTRQQAIEELQRCSGTQFDPEIVNIFIDKVLLNR